MKNIFTKSARIFVRSPTNELQVCFYSRKKNQLFKEYNYCLYDNNDNDKSLFELMNEMMPMQPTMKKNNKTTERRDDHLLLSFDHQQLNHFSHE